MKNNGTGRRPSNDDGRLQNHYAAAKTVENTS